MSVPLPGVDATSTEPCMPSTAPFTASMPTPRPDVSVTASAVLSPGKKYEVQAASASGILRLLQPVSNPCSTALFLSFSVSIPLPSSDDSNDNLACFMVYPDE